MKPTLSLVGIFMTLSLCSFVTLKSIAEEQVAVFAGGCFWCTESDFEKLDGVVSAESGYIGGHIKNPSYKQVSAGGSGHTEAVQVIFDDQKVSFSDLVEYFWKTIDPTDGGGQFCDRGQQYRSEIFYLSEEQHSIAKASKKALANSGLLKSEIATQLTPSSRFYLAEDYHQDYYLKNPVRYNYYRWGCGREKRLEALWGAVTK
jgi:methionine-S-sulfoxide reductase